MDKEERRVRVNEIESDLDDIREGIVFLLGNYMADLQIAGKTDLYQEVEKEWKKTLKKIDEITEYKLSKLR